MNHYAIRVEGLGKGYKIGAREQKIDTFVGSCVDFLKRPHHYISSVWRNQEFFWSLQDVNFEVAQGEVVGLIGANGAGKSTLLKILSQITEPTRGRVDIYGTVSSLLEVGTGFHPDLNGRENVYLNGAILGMRKKEIDAKYDEIVEFSGVEAFMETPVKRYSSGMRLRLAFSVSAHLNPDILLVDEVLAVGDASFQKKCMGKMNDVAGLGRTIVLVSHNLGAIQSLCNRVLLLKQGRLVLDGDPKSVIDHYLNDGTSEATGEQDHSIVNDPKIQIRKISILQEEEENPTVLTNQKSLAIQIDYAIFDPIPDLLLGFDLITSDGHHLFRSYDLAAGVSRGETGEYRSTLSFPAHLFKGQNYFLELLVAQHGVRWITRNEHRFVLSFIENEVLSVEFPGLLKPLGTWQVKSHVHT